MSSTVKTSESQGYRNYEADFSRDTELIVITNETESMIKVTLSLSKTKEKSFHISSRERTKICLCALQSKEVLGNTLEVLKMKIVMRNVYHMYTEKLQSKQGRDFVIIHHVETQNRSQPNEAHQHENDGDRIRILRPYVKNTETTLCLPFELVTLHNLIVGPEEQFRVNHAPTCQCHCKCRYRNNQYTRTIRDTWIKCHCVPDVSYEDNPTSD